MRPLIDDIEEVKAVYLDTNSCEATAAHFECSQSYIWSLLKPTGLVPDVPKYSESCKDRAEHLYVERKYSCRVVARVLAAEYDPAPSQQTVYMWLKDRSVLRSRSRADRMLNAAMHGKDYDALETKVVVIYTGEKLSLKATARKAGVSRGFVKRALKKNGVQPRPASKSQSIMQKKRSGRKARVQRAGELREFKGYTTAEIAAELKVSHSCAWTYLRDYDRWNA